MGKKLLLLSFVFMSIILGIKAQTYKRMTSPFIFYASIDNCAKEYANGWVTDGKGVSTFAAVANKKFSIDPQTDQEIPAAMFPAAGIKGAKANKGMIIYVAGVEKIKAYVCNASGTNQRIFVAKIAPNGGQAIDNSATLDGNVNTIIEYGGLNPDVEYKIVFESYEVDGVTGGDMVLRALKFITPDTDNLLSGSWTDLDFEAGNMIETTSIDLTRVTGLPDTKPAVINPNCLLIVPEGTAFASETNVVVKKASGYAANKISIKDGSSFNSKNEIIAQVTEYIRNYDMPAEGWVSLYLPFALDATALNGCVVEEFESYNNQTNSLVFKTVNETKANTPYLLKLTATGDKIFTAPSAKLLPTMNGGQEVVFKGTFKCMDSAETEGKYIMKKDGSAFAKAISPATVPAFRAYLEINSQMAGAPMYSIEHGDAGTTSISPVNKFEGLAVYPVQSGLVLNVNEPQMVKIYSVDGCMVYTNYLYTGDTTVWLEKGVYVVNNHKVIVK